MDKKIPLIVTIIVIGVFVAAYLSIPKSYGIYQEALELARKDRYVTEMLGDNINDGWFVYSKVSKGNAEFEIPIEGKIGEGLLQVYGAKVDDEWVLNKVFFLKNKEAKRYLVFNGEAK